MSPQLGLLIVCAILGLALGIWLGLPGRYDQSREDIEKIMDEGGGRRKKRQPVFTPLAWMQRRASAKASRSSRAARGMRGSGRAGFKLQSPEDRQSGS